MTSAGAAGSPRRRTPRARFAVGGLGLLALLAGSWAALLMLGLDVPTPRPDFAEVHGPLMVLGFLGTLIALERAVAIDLPAGYGVPAATGLGGLALILGAPLLVGQLLLDRPRRPSRPGGVTYDAHRLTDPAAAGRRTTSRGVKS
jgi:hypothetical protein